MTLEEQIAAEEARLEAAENEVRSCKRRLRVLKLDLAKRDFGVEVGSVVLHKGKEHKVTKVETCWDRKPWLAGNPKRKDGTFGTAWRNLFEDWEAVK